MKNLSIQRKLIIFIVLPVVLCTSLIVILSSIEIKKQGITDLINKSNAILGLNILEFTEHHIDGNSIVEMDVEESIRGVSSDVGSSSTKYQFRIASPNPLNEKHLAKTDDIVFFDKFKNESINELIHIDKDKDRMVVMRPVYMSESKGCLECHSNETGQSRYGNMRGLFILDSDIRPIQNQVNTSIFQYSIIGVLILIVSVVFAVIFSRTFTKPIIELKNVTENLALGDLNQHLNIKSGDEIGLIAVAFNKLINALNRIAEFSNEIGKGNFKQDYHLLSAKDTIGISLLNMRQSLADAKNKEIERQVKEDQENWSNQGIAKFSDILRSHSDNIDDLSHHFVRELVNYLNIVQGGLFVINEENPDDIYFNLQAAVAYNRQKLYEKQFRLGESLVGRCAYEKLPIYMTEVPENYVQITSGLGEANPRSILLVPAVMEGKVYAVIELVSFQEFPQYQLEFISKMGNNLASTISMVKIHEQTSKLLAESRIQQDELAAQEEELRQNMEELVATQEEMKRKENQLKQILDELEVQEDEMKKRIEKIKNL